MNPPFSITIEKITEATQCHNVVSQLLRIFPSLRLTITENETIPTPAGPPKTCCPVNGAFISRDDAFRALADRITAVQKAGRMGADSDAERTRTEARRAADAATACGSPAPNADGSYPWTPGAHTEAAAEARERSERIDAETPNRRDYQEDPDGDDSAYQ